MINTIKISALIATATLSFGMFSNAAAQDRKGPPQEAFEACATLNLDDACSFTSPRGEANGQCVAPPQSNDQQLVCLPEGMGKNGPPKQKS